jgi:hypothetical protein
MVSETTNISPFFTNYRFYLRLGVKSSASCLLNFSMLQKTQFYKANVIVNRFERILDFLKVLAKQSQQYYKDNTNTHCKDALIFKVGDKVYINTKNMKTN